MKCIQWSRLAILFSVFFLSTSLTINAQDESAESGFPGGICNDPSACNFNQIITISAQESEDLALGGVIIIGDDCVYPQWYIPFIDDGGAVLLGGGGGGGGKGVGVPAVLSCEPLEGYVLAEDQCCAANVIASDTYCIGNQWDSICQGAYESCSAAVVFGIDDCNDPAACNFNEDAFCSDNSGCEYAQWYIPAIPDNTDEEPNFPAILTCAAPLGYVIAEECCVIQEIIFDSYCVDTTWDVICQSSYDECLADGGTVIGCTDPNFCNYNPVACASDGSCYGEAGCTNPDACNYDDSVQCDNESCELPGCLDPEANNYNPAADCSSFFVCTYCNNCPGDFDGNGFINTTDLGAFLAAFGSECESPGGP
tara:strand:- start:10130 stop:11230 length:1101 start_codon:yes stop_codon:yes gene_type:complete